MGNSSIGCRAWIGFRCPAPATFQHQHFHALFRQTAGADCAAETAADNNRVEIELAHGCTLLVVGMWSGGSINSTLIGSTGSKRAPLAHLAHLCALIAGTVVAKTASERRACPAYALRTRPAEHS